MLAENVQDAGSVARYGGEEFAVIPTRRPAGGCQTADRTHAQPARNQEARHQQERRGDWQDHRFVGIAQLSVGEDAEKLVQRADAKLYEAKCACRNRVVAAESSVAT